MGAMLLCSSKAKNSWTSGGCGYRQGLFIASVMARLAVANWPDAWQTSNALLPESQQRYHPGRCRAGAVFQAATARTGWPPAEPPVPGTWPGAGRCSRPPAKRILSLAMEQRFFPIREFQVWIVPAEFIDLALFRLWVTGKVRHPAASVFFARQRSDAGSGRGGVRPAFVSRNTSGELVPVVRRLLRDAACRALPTAIAGLSHRHQPAGLLGSGT